MNVPFRLAKADLDKPFLQEAEAAGLLNLKGIAPWAACAPAFITP